MVKNVNAALYIIYTAHFTLLNTHFTLHTGHFTLYTIHCTLQTAQYTLHSAQCTQTGMMTFPFIMIHPSAKGLGQYTAYKLHWATNIAVNCKIIIPHTENFGPLSSQDTAV